MKTVDKNNRGAIISLVVYFSAAVAMTWPAAVEPFMLHIDKRFDVGVFWWGLWWMKRALWDLHVNPFICDYLMYPHGLNVVFQSPAYLYGFLSIPVQLVLGVERGISLSTNLILVGSTALTGWGMWLLARKVTRDPRAAYVAGCAFAFAPFRFWHTGRFHLICTEFLVFYIFAFWVSLESGRKSHAVAAGALFAAVVYSSPTYAMYAALMSLFIAARFVAVEEGGLKKTALQSSIAATCGVVISLPWLIAAAALVSGNHSGAEKGYGEIIKYSGDLVGYFFPGRSQRLLGPLLGDIGDGYAGIGGGEIFLGYILMAAALVAAFRYARRGAGFWLASAVVFWIVSLGPRLKAAGDIFFPLPYSLLLKLGPVFKIDRDPCRYVALVMLCLSVAAAFGATTLSGGGKRRWVYLFIPLLILAEFFQAPLEMKKITFPRLYYDMRRDGMDYAVLELPLESPFPRRYVRVYQSMHQKPIIYSIPRRQRERYDFLEDNRFFADLYDPSTLLEHPDELIFEANRDFLITSKLRYVVLHEKLTDPIVYGLWDALLKAHRPVEIIDEPTLRAYRFY